MVNIDKVIFYKAVQSLTTQLNFSPLRGPGRETSIEEERMFIAKSSGSCACVLEMTDGDSLNFGSEDELADLILNGTDFEKIDPLSFYINLYWFSGANHNNSSEFNELFKQRYSEAASEYKNISYILINSSSKTICSAGLMAPYHVVYEVLKGCLKDSGEQQTAAEEETVKRLSDYEKSTVIFDKYDNYNSFTHFLTFFYLFYVVLLVVTGLWAGIFLKFWGKSFDSSFLPYFHDSDLLAIAANLTALLTVAQLAESNYNIRKHILITFLGGLIGGIPLYYFYGCFYNWVLPSCGALLYIKFRTKSNFSGHKHVIYCLYAYLLLTVILTYLRDSAYGFTSFGGIAAGFFISGIMHFEGEFVDKSIEKHMWVGLGITVFILLLLRLWLNTTL